MMLVSWQEFSADAARAAFVDVDEQREASSRAPLVEDVPL